jgi:UDP-N-acetylglucosamine 2-epimerase (non-hydrolysing)
LTLAVVFGTRPEALKIGPCVAELRALGIEPAIICTNQHVELLRGGPAETDLKDGISLRLASTGNVGKWIGRAVPVIKDALRDVGATALLAQGDTMSAYAGSVAASLLQLPIHHIEAGIRSHTLQEPYPEELLRTRISARASWHYAPTEGCRRNLWREGISDSRIVVTGNPVVSALARYSEARHVEKPANQILVTMHRREWLAKGMAHVHATILAVRAAAVANPSVRFWWPMHPGVEKMACSVGGPNLYVGPPLSYRDATLQLSHSLGVITDSGGLQEEAATLGVPCAVMRNVSDRPESIGLGLAKLFPPTPEGVSTAVRTILGRELPRKPSDCYGKPDSAFRIALAVAQALRNASFSTVGRPESPLPAA